MKNFSVKKSLMVMTAAAVLSSAFLLAQSAFGLNAPVTNPQDAAGVSPTFNGVNLNGDITFKNGSKIKSGSDASGNYVMMENSNIYGVNGLLDTSLVIGKTVGGQGLIITPTKIQRSGGNLDIVTNAGSSIVFGSAGGANNLNVANGSVTVSGNVNVGGTVVVAGGLDLPFRTVSAGIAASTANTTTPVQYANCPVGAKIVSCQIYPLTGIDLMGAVGANLRTDGIAGCTGRYRQIGAGNTSASLTAVCL